MTYPETGDLWEYVPYGKIYLIMERTNELHHEYMILRLDIDEVFRYDFMDHVMDLWRKIA